MAHIEINKSLLGSLKDKIVVLTGGANGIGREAVRLFHQHGAKIIFGDVNDDLGQALETELNSRNAKYVHCDVTSYTSQLNLFSTAISTFGSIDVVVANAGISVPKDPFAPDADIEQEFSTKEIDVNLKGCLFTARIGMHYLRKNERGGGDLVLVSSIAGFKESTGLAVYTASKHGVLGLLRGVRVQAEREGIRVNAVCPWMTKTAMVAGIEAGWKELHLPENEPEDVANSILICATANRVEDSNSHKGAKLPFTGKIVFVAGGQSYEIEDSMQELEPEWLGRENSKSLVVGQDFLMNGETSWDTEKAKENL